MWFEVKDKKESNSVTSEIDKTKPAAPLVLNQYNSQTESEPVEVADCFPDWVVGLKQLSKLLIS